MVHLGRGIGLELEYCYNGCMGDCLDLKQSDRIRGMVDIWRWSVREALLYMYVHIHTSIISKYCLSDKTNKTRA